MVVRDGMSVESKPARLSHSVRGQARRVPEKASTSSLRLARIADMSETAQLGLTKAERSPGSVHEPDDINVLDDFPVLPVILALFGVQR